MTISIATMERELKQQQENLEECKTQQTRLKIELAQQVEAQKIYEVDIADLSGAIACCKPESVKQRVQGK